MPINKLPTLALESNAITADLIASGAITAADISDGEITAAKLHTTLDFSTKTFTMHNNHVTQAMVTQHQAALSVTQSQISDLSTTTDLTEGSNLYFTNARADARIAAATTTDLTEGTNLYFTNARADARIAAADTDDLSEGSTNLYFTNARADARAQLKIDALVDSAPNTLDTLNELAAALGDDANFSTTVTNSIATKLPLAGGTMTGNVSFGDNDKAVFGGLLEIYGDGTHARIREYGSGQMKIQGDNMQLLTSAGTSTYLEGNASTGAVTLYHLSNAPRISTTATGVDVNGGISTGGVSAPTSSDTGNVYVPSGSTLGFQTHSGNIAWNGVFNSGWKYIASNVATLINGNNSGLSFYTAASGTAGNALTWDEKFTIHLDGYSTTRGRGFTVDNSDATWHAINIAESIDNRIAFRITPTRQGQTKGISMGAIGQNTSSTGLQAYDTSDNSANAFLINPWGGNVGIGKSSPASKLHIKVGDNAYTGGIQIEDTDSTTKSAITHVNGTLWISSNSTADHLAINSLGNVGIGTTSLGQKFQVYIDNSNDLEYGYRDTLIIDRLSDENMDDASASVPADRYWPLGNLKLADGNVFNSDSNGPGLSFYKHRDNSGNEYVQAFIGTRGVYGSNNTDLRFYVNSANAANLLPTSPQMLISGANGNVGINHDAPRSKLHVTSNNTGFVTSNGVGIEGIQVTRNTGTHGENMYMYTSSGVGWSGNQYIGRVESFGNNTLEIGTQQNLTKAISFGANNIERMVIEGAGNVGINKSDPSATLDIANSDVSQTTLNVTPPGSGDQPVALISRGYGSHKGSGLKISGNNYTNGSNTNAAFLDLSAGSYSGSNTRFIHAYDNSGTNFVVRGDGKVGIGTSSPDVSLHVNGAAIVGSQNNHSSSPIAGLHILDQTYSTWDSTLSKKQVALRVETHYTGNNGHARAAGDYGGGIGFNHLGGHSTQHDENVHGWIGLRVVDTPGHERSALVFATNNVTTDEDAGILERASISPEGRFTFKQFSTNSSQIHNSVGYTDLYKFSFSMNMMGNQAYVIRTSGHGNGILRIMAQGSHWSSPYGLWRESYCMLDNNATLSESNMHNQTSSQQGSWSFSRHSASEIDIVKAAGTYAGGMLTNIIIYSPRVVNVVGVY